MTNHPLPAADAGCLDDSDPHSLPLTTARAHILDAMIPINDIERVPLGAARQRILGADLCAPADIPPSITSAMDGYALCAGNPALNTDEGLGVIGTALAGKPYPGRVAAGQCVRIMTGGWLPEGTDTVVMQEQTHREGDRVYIDTRPGLADNTRPAGEEARRGEVLIARGTRLGPAHIGLIAATGATAVDVVRRARIALLCTGDELRDIGEVLGPGQIHDSNRYSLAALLDSPALAVTDYGIVTDDPAQIERILREASATADVVISSGGVSVGEADFVREVFARIGEIGFWKVAMKPGRPLAFGRAGTAWFFGLPGNPVSALVTCMQLVMPALDRLCGMTVEPPLLLTATCQSRLKKRPGRIEFQRGILQGDDQGRLSVKPTGAQGSGILGSMAHANCFIVLPEDCAGVAQGETVLVQPFGYAS